MVPGSLRVGLRGRDSPVFIEDRSAKGFGRDIRGDRKVSPGEIGVGVDVLAVGAYGGVALDEAADFVLGWFGVDFRDDDLQ